MEWSARYAAADHRTDDSRSAKHSTWCLDLESALNGRLQGKNHREVAVRGEGGHRGLAGRGYCRRGSEQTARRGVGKWWY
jgi:hypothetical protein